MPYVHWDEMDSEDQMDALHKAVSELQNRFRGHRHAGANGEVAVSIDNMDSTDLEGKFVEDDC